MTQQPGIETFNDADLLFPFEYELEVTQSGMGDVASKAVIVPYMDKLGRKLQELLFTLAPNPVGSGRVEVTTNAARTIRENPSAVVWAPWPRGNVSAITQDDCKAVTAFRLVAASGTVTVAVKGV